jgi:hypothetical protein
MAPRTRYRLDRVAVVPGEQRASTWTFAGRPMSGIEQMYLVQDGNLPAPNRWEFVLRYPADRNERIEVRPRTTPNVKVWAELPDRSLTFSRATKGEARGKWYCLVALADPTGSRSRTVIRGDERSELPPWFDQVKSRMRLKQTVRSTRGTDGESLVVLVQPGDYSAMIRLFFATKVWILKERVSLRP